ncbi:hypothetical protein L227DRAFT_603213 [Lentinus tigrinus ALCF2SS1-6]|uniref:Uncharacterized protein n=1 Tax=Lentinus tigrinus ALCF2SS1-6 TaxID=1328759 RepID=A0A5C2RXZ9_9APHY|nr:hypothetical protein L227DRAFT_603213 [Lentinus tigrinus ALCF2SS1-6]
MPNIYSLPQEVTVNVCSYVLMKHPVSFLGWRKDEKALARLARTCRASHYCPMAHSPKHPSLDLDSSVGPPGTGIISDGYRRLAATVYSIYSYAHTCRLQSLGDLLRASQKDEKYALLECSPYLRKLPIRWDYGSPERAAPMGHHQTTALSQKFRAFSHLQDLLGLNGIHILPSALRSIGALPSLRMLKISISRVDYPASWKTLVPIDDPECFPQLRSLICEVDDLALLADIIRIVSSPLLETVIIESSQSHHDSFELFCEVLSCHRSREALRCISHAGFLSEPCDLNAAFTYLSVLPSITHIVLVTSSIVMLSDDTLEVLTLPIDPWCDAFLTVDIADRAPRWEHDFRPVPPSRSALVNLYTGFIDAEPYPIQVAGIISAMFPHLQEVGYGDLGGGLYRFHGWDEVNRVLRAFRGVRVQEQRWADKRRRMVAVA